MIAARRVREAESLRQLLIVQKSLHSLAAYHAYLYGVHKCACGILLTTHPARLPA